MVSAAVNQLIPAPYDILWSGVAVLTAGLALIAVVSILRHCRGLSWPSYVLWLLVVLAMPLVGSLLWFMFARDRVRTQSAELRAQERALRPRADA